MPNVVFDASSIVGAVLKQNSTPERAFLLACRHDVLYLSPSVTSEIREVLARPKFRRYIVDERRAQVLDVMAAMAIVVEPELRVTDC